MFSCWDKLRFRGEHCFQQGLPFLLCWIAINHTLVEKSYNHGQNSYNKLELICVFHVKSCMPNPTLHPTDNMLDICMQFQKKNALYLSVNVFSTKVLIGDTIFTSPTGDGTAILRGHPSHSKV